MGPLPLEGGIVPLDVWIHVGGRSEAKHWKEGGEARNLKFRSGTSSIPPRFLSATSVSLPRFDVEKGILLDRELYDVSSDKLID